MALLAGSCDYPEQGFYELSAVDGYGLPIASWPLMVEELTDDTHMTYGFNLLLPVEGELLELPLTNSADMTRRSWTLSLSHADLGAGDLDLELVHAAERLSFTGAYRVPPPVELPERPAMATVDPPETVLDTRPGYAFGGYLPAVESGSNEIIINGDLPPLPEDLAGAVGFELRSITQEQFEQALGVGVDDALRRLAEVRAPLTASDEPPEESAPAPAELEPIDGEEDEDAAADMDDEKQAKPVEDQPPLGGRDGKRPR